MARISVGGPGSLPYLGNIGGVRVIGTLGRARPAMAKRLLGTNSLHTAVGSHYLGSWEDISQFQTKTYSVLSSQHGSLFLVTGALGTYRQGLTGTTYRVQLGAGTVQVTSFTDAFQWARPIVRIGSTGSGKGTLRLARNFQV